jgi:hypothetical protein
LIDNYGDDEQLIKAWVLGQFVPLFANNVYRFNELTHCGDYPAIRDCSHIILGWDFNVGQVAWAAQQMWEGQVRQIAEAPLKCDTTDDACDAFIRAFPPAMWRNHELIIDGDASGWHRDTRAYFSDYDIILNKLRALYPRVMIRAPRSNESVRTRIVLTNRALARNLFVIDRSCKQTIRSMNQCTYDGRGGIEKPTGDTWTHWADAATYPLCTEFPLHDMTPQSAVY